MTDGRIRSPGIEISVLAGTCKDLCVFHNTGRHGAPHRQWGQEARTQSTPDGRGDAIEVVAVVLPHMLLVIHAMPTRYRKTPT